MTNAARDYADRAESFRRLAEERDDVREREALLAIAAQYDEVAARLGEVAEGDEP